MERRHHQNRNDSDQQQQNENVLTSFASIVMQSSSRQVNPNHQSNHIPQDHSQVQALSHTQPQNQLGPGARPGTTTSGSSISSQSPHTRESSELSYSLPPNHHGRSEGMDLITSWGRSAGLPSMKDAYAHATAATHLSSHLQLPLSILSAETYNPGTADASKSTRTRQHSTSQGSGSMNAVGMGQDQAMNSWGLMRVNENQPNSATKSPPKRKTSDGDGSGKGKKKKQKIESLSDDDEAKKSRGRPRLDPKDETAADRRRTQIRMAQRAYRHRKETTISTLEAQVQDLKGTNEEMSTVFINLYEMAVKNGLLQREPDFGKELKSATEKFQTLTQNAAIDSEAKEEESPASGSRNQSLVDEQSFSSQQAEPQQLEHSKADTPQRVTNSVWGYQITEEPEVEQENIDYGSMSFAAPPLSQEEQANSLTVITRATEDNSSFPWDLPYAPERDQGQQANNRTVITRATEDNSSLPWDLPYAQDQDQGQQANNHTVITRATEENASFPFDVWPDLQTFNADVPQMDDYSTLFPSQSIPSQSLPLPESFAYSEASFSRRLHRKTIENAYMLITMPSPPPTQYRRVFSFCLRFESKFAIELRLRTCLERSAKESVNYWNSPFVHLGGAGTQYPPDPIDVNSETMPKFRTGLSMGPFSPNVMDTRNNYVTDDLHITLPGLQGAFLDANDVEGYLRGKGIEIRPGSDFVEVDLDVLQEYDDLSPSSSPADEFPHVSRNPPQSQSAQNQQVISSGYFDTISSSQPANSYFNGQSSSQIPSSSTAGVTDHHPVFVDQIPSDPAFQFRDDFDWSFGQKDGQNFNNDSFGLPEKKKRSVKLEVEALMQAIMRGAVCLGRAPGFRPADVDYAIRAGLSNARAKTFGN